ncbi:MAG TPA: hypothetical protein VHD35_11205 [Chitinophagaceae bacterium]|jgi:hypothetical protein|nr:hypothetical protein [Chitinophagaceae bacterium]
MKNYKTILFLFIIPLFLSTGFLKKMNGVDHKNKSGNISSYEVKLTFTGYTSLYSSNPLQDCDIRKNGRVILSGVLSGQENVDPDDDIEYTGVLQDSIDMDICSVKRLSNGEDEFCYMTVTGSGPVKTELKIYSDGQNNARGSYIQIEYNSTLGKFNRKVVGNCDPNEMVEEENMVPNKTIASIFNGAELPINTRTLKRGATYVENGPSGKLEIEVE